MPLLSPLVPWPCSRPQMLPPAPPAVAVMSWLLRCAGRGKCVPWPSQEAVLGNCPCRGNVVQHRCFPRIRGVPCVLPCRGLLPKFESGAGAGAARLPLHTTPSVRCLSSLWGCSGLCLGSVGCASGQVPVLWPYFNPSAVPSSSSNFWTQLWLPPSHCSCD